MMFVRALNDQERQELKRLARREVGRVSERIRMILLSSKGYSVPQIADIFECDAASVRAWIERFEAEGVQGLHDRPRSGRPRKADVVAQHTIRQAVQTQPAALGYIFGFWTVVTLCTHLLVTIRVHVSTATVRRVLWQLGYRWRRPRHTLPTDPEAREKMWGLCEQLLRAPKEAVILCLDECDIHLLPVLRSMWMLRGAQAGVPTPGLNGKRSVFGALEWDTGRWLYEVTERRRSVEFIAFMEKLMLSYPGRPLLLVLDNATIHKSKAVMEWLALAEQASVRLLYLPTYAGHKENPVEKVWWRLKSQVAANRLHQDIDALIACVHQFFASFTPQAARQLVSAA